MQINIKGEELELNVALAKELGVLVPHFKHKVGNHYKIERNNNRGFDLYVLSFVNSMNEPPQVALVNILTGWGRHKVSVKNSLNLSLLEWEAVCSTAPQDKIRHVQKLELPKLIGDAIKWQTY